VGDSDPYYPLKGLKSYPENGFWLLFGMMAHNEWAQAFQIDIFGKIPPIQDISITLIIPNAVQRLSLLNVGFPEIMRDVVKKLGYLPF